MSLGLRELRVNVKTLPPQPLSMALYLACCLHMYCRSPLLDSLWGKRLRRMCLYSGIMEEAPNNAALEKYKIFEVF